MDFNKQKALTHKYVPVNHSTVLIPVRKGIDKIFEREVKGKFERGKIVQVSGDDPGPYYAELVKSSKEDYVPLFKEFSAVLKANFDSQIYSTLKECLNGEPLLREYLMSILPKPPKTSNSDTYKIIPDYLQGWK